MKVRGVACAALAAATLAGAGHAQTYTNFDDVWGRWRDDGAQLSAQEQAVMQQLMSDPTIRAAYQEHMNRGGPMRFDQFAYHYARTCGFEPACAARSAAVDAGIHYANAGAYGGGEHGGHTPPTSDYPGAAAGAGLQGMHIEGDPNSPTGCSYVAHTAQGTTHSGGPAPCPR